MAFCQNCGTAVDGRFCAKCGAQVGQESAPPMASSAAPMGAGASGLTDNIAGALAYIPVIGVIFLLIEPYNRNKSVRFHAFQGLFLLAAAIVVNIAFSTLYAISWSFLVLAPLIHLGFAVLWLFLMYKAYVGQKILLPIIGPMAEKQA